MKDNYEQVVAYRAKLKQKLKDEYRRQVWDPRRYAKEDGAVVSKLVSCYFS